MKPGDVVQLKSGGQLMTVERLFEDKASCVYWNADAKKFDSDSFAVIVLRVVES